MLRPRLLVVVVDFERGKARLRVLVPFLCYRTLELFRANFARVVLSIFHVEVTGRPFIFPRSQADANQASKSTKFITKRQPEEE